MSTSGGESSGAPETFRVSRTRDERNHEESTWTGMKSLKPDETRTYQDYTDPPDNAQPVTLVKACCNPVTPALNLAYEKSQRE